MGIFGDGDRFLGDGDIPIPLHLWLWVKIRVFVGYGLFEKWVKIPILRLPTPAKERLMRKNAALEQAIGVYISEKTLLPETHFTMHAAEPGCTKAYRIGFRNLFL